MGEYIVVAVVVSVIVVTDYRIPLLSEEDWRGRVVWTIAIIICGNVQFDDDSGGLIKE